jgi:hypothetical protein
LVVDFARIISLLQTDQKITAAFVWVVSIIQMRSQKETFTKRLVQFTGLNFTWYYLKAGRSGRRYLTTLLEL